MIERLQANIPVFVPGTMKSIRASVEVIDNGTINLQVQEQGTAELLMALLKRDTLRGVSIAFLDDGEENDGG